jgi:uncharacterized protein (DUF2236 family)
MTTQTRAAAVNTAHSYDEIPQEAYDSLCGLALSAGGANVIMQLSKLGVGHGVARSRVESGRVDRHPIKRARTTTAFLVIAFFGTTEEQRALQREINRAHGPVHSEPGERVQYDAFDPELQLWVASCLIKGAFDLSELLNGPVDPERAEALYQFGKRLGTMLQVPEDMFPNNVGAFWEYFETAPIEMDDLTRSYLQGIADLRFFVAPLGPLAVLLRPIVRPIGRFMTLGWLPRRYLDLLDLPWDERKQRRHDAFFGRLARLVMKLPRPLREFPLNVVLWDTRRRIRQGRSVIGELRVSSESAGG